LAFFLSLKLGQFGQRPYLGQEAAPGAWFNLA